jgi:hypothetical protein
MMTLQVYRAKPNPAGKDKTGSGIPKPEQLVAEWVDIENVGSESIRFQYSNLIRKVGIKTRAESIFSKTDADGKFRLMVPPDREYVITANASRAVSSDVADIAIPEGVLLVGHPGSTPSSDSRLAICLPLVFAFSKVAPRHFRRPRESV